MAALLMRLPNPRPWIIGLAGVAIGTLIVLSVLMQTRWDPSYFAAFGSDAGPTRQYAESRLGEVELRPAQGHDGKYFFIQANDPWLLHPSEHAEYLGRPLYRSQRMAYPALAGGLGLFGPEVIIWSLIVVNVLALGAGTWAVAELAIATGGSSLWGLSFTLNLGLLYEMRIDGAGVVAAAFAFWGVLLISRRTYASGVACLALAALSREAFLIVALGAAIWVAVFERERREAATILLAPLSAVVAWAAYLRLRIPHDAGATEVRELGTPLLGVAEAVGSWLERPADLVIGAATIAAMVAFVWLLIRRPSLLGFSFAGFIPLATLLSRRVWEFRFDITRAVAPALTALVIMAVADRVASSYRGAQGLRPQDETHATREGPSPGY